MKSFNKIMESFKRTVEKLEKLEDANLNSKFKLDAEINEMAFASDKLKEEAEIAARTAEKLRAFYEAD